MRDALLAFTVAFVVSVAVAAIMTGVYLYGFSHDCTANGGRVTTDWSDTTCHYR